MSRMHPALLGLLGMVACAPGAADDDDDGGSSGRCDPADATGPTGRSVVDTLVYQAGDIAEDVDLIGPDGDTVSLYDMCGKTVMLVHGELG